MTKEEAIKILISVAVMAQKAGVLTLADARIAMNAVELLEKTDTAEQTEVEDVTEPAPSDAE